MTAQTRQPAASQSFLLRWVSANMLGEIVGFGAATGVAVLFISLVEPTLARFAALGMFAVMVFAGSLEGAAVGVAQWWVLRQRLPRLRAQQWILATVIGAVLAWALGMLPSTLNDLSSTAAVSAAAPPDWLMIVMGFPLGLVLGVILAVPQWVVLRQHVPNAAVWIVANAVAWAVGMAVMFAGASSSTESTPMMVIVLVGLLTGLTAGAVVGVIHGTVLVRLLNQHTS